MSIVSMVYCPWCSLTNYGLGNSHDRQTQVKMRAALKQNLRRLPSRGILHAHKCVFSTIQHRVEIFRDNELTFTKLCIDKTPSNVQPSVGE